MDVFVRNVPEQATEKQLRACFQSHLQTLGIYTFDCHKFKGKPNAIVTIADLNLALNFLNRHGKEMHSNRKAQVPIYCQGRQVYCERSKNESDPFLLACLRKEETDRKMNEKKQSQNKKENTPAKRSQTHRFDSLENGQWGYQRDELVFLSSYSNERQGSIHLNQKVMAIVLNARDHKEITIRIDVPYDIVYSIITGQRNGQATLTLMLENAPKMYKMTEKKTNADPTSMMQGLSLAPKRREYELRRIGSLDEKQLSTVSTCFAYRFVLSGSDQPQHIFNTLKDTRGAPLLMRCNVRVLQCDFKKEMQHLKHELENTYALLPFAIRFQLQRLAQNGYVRPELVTTLLPDVVSLSQDYEMYAIVSAIRKLARTIPFAGTDVAAKELHPVHLVSSLRQSAANYIKAGTIYDTVTRHEHVALIHKVFVSPAGTYLEGPELETRNRVLRKYQDHPDNFVRVSFVDEDFDRFRPDFAVMNYWVLYERFQDVLDTGFDIAGKTFRFLGFSHSSLREAQCWMLAEIDLGVSKVDAQGLLQDLGDFSLIRSPAKCAARIGQAFSDATDTVPVDKTIVKKIPDIERNGRVFTDGVGTVSEDFLQLVWKKFARSKKQRATLLQIRYQGAKGMLALDSTLTGQQICLRPSMIKYEGSAAANLEICGAAFRPLPTHLNLDFIKVLEDLGVPAESFLNLQRRAIEDLEVITESPINAARFLEVNQVALNAQIPNLIRLLGEIGLSFWDDKFCRSILELGRLTRLRDMKYRGRIPVPEAHTLYGIADETGILAEGEVYCVVRNKNGQKDVLLGPALITRAPAMHPGDFQIVNAVDVPPGSPLQNLHNCVVFSQHGERDLASQLSGGDLDGDLFNVIWDTTLWPKTTYTPADYGRPQPIDIKRPVEARDMTEFFITFMDADQLGRICNTHRQIADQMPEGSLHSMCINLAEMASIAVDFAKTGIMVDITKMPDRRLYNSRAKPDFMAHAPRLIIKDASQLQLDNTNPAQNQDEEEDAIAMLNPEKPQVRFYESRKVLGQLYRAIDETKYLPTLVKADTEQTSNTLGESNDSVLASAWDYVRKSTLHIPWEHHRAVARDIRIAYEENLIETLYQYSPDLHHPITELEVFGGSILGKDGSLPNKRIRESATDMRTKFDRDVLFTIRWMKKGDTSEANMVGEGDEDDEDEQGGISIEQDESFARSIACFDVAMEEDGQRVKGLGYLKSFAYIAAAVCLRELKRFNGGSLKRTMTDKA